MQKKSSIFFAYTKYTISYRKEKSNRYIRVPESLSVSVLRVYECGYAFGPKLHSTISARLLRGVPGFSGFNKTEYEFRRPYFSCFQHISTKKCLNLILVCFSGSEKPSSIHHNAYY